MRWENDVVAEPQRVETRFLGQVGDRGHRPTADRQAGRERSAEKRLEADPMVHVRAIDADLHSGIVAERVRPNSRPSGG
jgi:hypothetical protein